LRYQSYCMECAPKPYVFDTRTGGIKHRRAVAIVKDERLNLRYMILNDSTEEFEDQEIASQLRLYALIPTTPTPVDRRARCSVCKRRFRNVN
jgi:hypothetical protein